VEHPSSKKTIKMAESLFVPVFRVDKSPWLIWTILGRRVREEEQDDLPLLEHTLKADESVSCAKSFARTKLFAPTRVTLIVHE
jgi:hypothetical protein